MEGIDLNRSYNSYELSKLKHKNRSEMGTLPIHELSVEKYTLLLTFFPFNEKKEKIFKSLDKSQKMGMLNRHVLSVARKIDISQVLIKKAKEISKDLASARKNSKKNTFSTFFKPEYYKEQETRYRGKLEEYYSLILDMILEEAQRRMDVKYMRKKKLEEITQLRIDK